MSSATRGGSRDRYRVSRFHSFALSEYDRAATLAEEA